MIRRIKELNLNILNMRRVFSVAGGESRGGDENIVISSEGSHVNGVPANSNNH